MRFSAFCLAAVLSSVVAQECASNTCDSKKLVTTTMEPPLVAAKLMRMGRVSTPEDHMTVVDVMGCCGYKNDDYSSSSAMEPKKVGQMVQFSTDETLQILQDAKQAWAGGTGVWPQMSLKERVAAIEEFLNELGAHREEIVVALMWEIGKNRLDAEAEFDRTVSFARQVIEVIRSDSEFVSGWQTVGSTKAFVRRAAIGIIMCLGPMNYPLNETYATLIPALLMGNIAIMKIPTVGGLAHLLTMEAFAKTLPPGTMNFVSGRGRETMPPLMRTGDIDGLAFIGGSSAADDLISQHPHPHRLKVFLQLEAKNMAIFLPDIFEPSKDAELESALDQAVLGSLSFNGQRCTALKLFFIPKAHGDEFAKRLAARVESKHVGLPWQTFPSADGESESYSSITPLPGQKQVKYMKSLIDDAVSKGAKIMNDKGGEVVGGDESTLMVPAVLYPVTPDMKIYREEQFGPVVPVTTYESLDTVLEYGRDGLYGQQVSIFVSNQEIEPATMLLDKFSSVFGKVNINQQCGRSPDSLPFSGRRSSAMGVMSVKNALLEFSIPTVVAYKENSLNDAIVQKMQLQSKFLEAL